MHDTPTERYGDGRAWSWREATADQIEPALGRMRLRQARMLRRTAAAERHRQGLLDQAALLSTWDKVAGFPRLVGVFPERTDVTLVTELPSGQPWREVFGPVGRMLDRVLSDAALAVAADLCVTLAFLHGKGLSHRNLSPDTVFVDRMRSARLRDLGFAGIAPTAGEGEACQAPEQLRSPESADVYQLGAMLYHCLSGHQPDPRTSPPVRASVPDFPQILDTALLEMLDPVPARRPADLRVLARTLRRGRRELSQVPPR